MSDSMSPQEIKHVNKDRDRCVECRTKTKILLNQKYCPLGCDIEKRKISVDLDLDIDDFNFMD